ncbi:MAG: hypothetical protein NTY38_09385 [Acidobacteria bacterium]|nr:hypothetical protein [Acidobacteriota bacterium]
MIFHAPRKAASGPSSSAPRTRGSSARRADGVRQSGVPTWRQRLERLDEIPSEPKAEIQADVRLSVRFFVGGSRYLHFLIIGMQKVQKATFVRSRRAFCIFCICSLEPVSIKLHDKFGLPLMIETTVSDLAFFKHYREVEHRDGSREIKWASMQKIIYSLPALRELL